MMIQGDSGELESGLVIYYSLWFINYLSMSSCCSTFLYPIVCLVKFRSNYPGAFAGVSYTLGSSLI